MRPDLKWLVLKGQAAANSAATLAAKSLPHPFKPLGIAYKSTARARGRLFVGDEPLANVEGDLAAQFGQDGNLLIIPEAGQRIYPARREFKAEVTDMSGATNDISVALLGLQYTGLPQPRDGRDVSLRWVNLYGQVTASSTSHLTDTLDFPFMPLSLGYASTDRAEVILQVDEFKFNKQAGDLAAIFGTLGNFVAIPKEGRRKYAGKTTFDAVVTDLSGSTNIVTATLFGLQFRR